MSELLLESEKYRVERELGRGGMGVVYLAKDLRLDRTVALKVLNEHLNRDQEFVKRFHREASLISSLYHPNVVVVHGLEEVGGRFVIDMEYVDGISLVRRDGAAPLAPPVAVRIASDILEGLVACHGIGVIHRDIKPANILLNRVGTAKIVDFGLATAYAGHVRASISSRVSSSFFMGTPGYAPPVAWEGFDPDPGWDLYSVGVILYELLSGKVAFPGTTPMAIVRQHLAAPLPPLIDVAPEISPELSRIVGHLIDASATPKLPPAAEILDTLKATPEFQKVREGDTARTVTIAIRRQRRAHRWKPWRPRLKRAGTVLLIFLVGVAGGLALRPASPGEGPVTAPQAPPAPKALELPKGPLYFRPSVGEDGSIELWVVEPDSAGHLEVTVVGNRDLARLSLTPTAQEGQFDVAGHWGEYSEPLNGGVRYGDVRGSAIFPPGGGVMSVLLGRTNARDGVTHTDLNLLNVAGDESGPADFVQTLESSRIAQSLLYNELLPRKLAWAAEIETQLPRRAADRIAVPRGDTAITVDGMLNESLWAVEPDGVAQPVRARWSAEAVVIGLHATAPQGGADLAVALFMVWPSPQEEAMWVVVTRAEDGTLAAVVKSESREDPWACDWEVVAATSGGEWSAEIRIPLAALESRALPGADRPWRMNARLQRTDTGETVTTWGAEALDAVDHGLLLSFEENAP